MVEKKKMSSKSLAILGVVFLFLFFPVGFVLLFLALRRKGEEGAALREQKEQEATAAALARVHAKMEEAGTSGGGSSGEYQYSGVDVCILRDMDPDLSLVDIGDDADLKLEEDNEADPQAVAVYVGGQHIGYLYRGRLKRMVYDFLKRDDSVSAEVSAVDGVGVRLNISLAR